MPLYSSPDTVCLHSRAIEKVTFFTALKRSLRRLCFHKRLVRGVFASGPGGVLASGPRGVCLGSKGVFASGPEGSFCLWSGGCLPLVQGGVCLWSRGGCLPLVPGEVSASGLGGCLGRHIPLGRLPRAHIPLGKHPHGKTTPSWADTPLGRFPPLWTDTPWVDTTLPPPSITGYGRQAGGMHPTEMHSCLTFDLFWTSGDSSSGFIHINVFIFN